MRRFPGDVTDTELAMLQVLWQEGRATRRQIADALYPGGAAAHYATVQKLMERLQEKGYVKHSRQKGVLVYTARVDREELVNRRLREDGRRRGDPLLCGPGFANRLTPAGRRAAVAATRQCAWLRSTRTARRPPPRSSRPQASTRIAMVPWPNAWLGLESSEAPAWRWQSRVRPGLPKTPAPATLLRLQRRVPHLERHR